MHPGGLARSFQKQNNAPTPRDNFFSKIHHSPHVRGGFPGLSPGEPMISGLTLKRITHFKCNAIASTNLTAIVNELTTDDDG